MSSFPPTNPYAQPLAVYCRQCGYPLRGLPGGRCPECGRAFDLNDFRSFAWHPPRVRLRWWLKRAAAALLLALVLIACVPLWYWWQWRTEQHAIADVEALGARVDHRPFEPNWLGQRLPTNWAYLHDHVYAAKVLYCPADRVAQLNFAAFPRLEDVTVWYSNADDNVLEKLGGLSTLRDLNLAGNPLNGSGLAHLAGCRRLTSLDLARTRLNDSAMPNVGKLTTLKTLSIRNTAVTDAGMESLLGLSLLETLDIQDTPITDAGLMRLRGLASLKQVNADGSKVTEQGKREMRKAVPKLTFFP